MNISEPVTDTATRPSYVYFTGILVTRRGWAIFIFCVSLLLRVAYTLTAVKIDPFLIRDPLLGDAASYDRIARTLLAGGAYGESIGHPSAFWPPMYPFFLTAVYWAFGYQPMLARLIQAVLGAVLPLMVFLIGEQLQENRVARWASLGAALYPYLIYFGAWLIAESLYFALLSLILWTGIRLQQLPSYRKACVVGLLIGLATLAKPTILMQLPFMAIWFLFCIPSASVYKRLTIGAITALMLMLVIIPWSTRNYGLFGKFIPISTNGGYTFYGANNESAFGGHYENFPPKIKDLNEVDEQTEYYRLGTTWIKNNPGQFAWLVAQKFKRLVSPLSVASSEHDFMVPASWAIYSIYSVFLLISLYGILLSLRRWREFFLLYTPILGVMTSTLLFYGDVRYTLPTVPSLLLFGILGLNTIGSKLVRRS
jgi:4-amino-4-deoxy-L-arabinose transferase-like glycosyltransferase